MLIREFNPLPINVDRLDGGTVTRRFAKVVREQQIKGVGEAPADQESHGVRIGAELEDPANVVSTEVVEQSQHDLDTLQGIADVPFLSCAIAKYAVHAPEERAVAEGITDERRHPSQACPLWTRTSYDGNKQHSGAEHVGGRALVDEHRGLGLAHDQLGALL